MLDEPEESNLQTVHEQRKCKERQQRNTEYAIKTEQNVKSFFKSQKYKAYNDGHTKKVFYAIS